MTSMEPTTDPMADSSTGASAASGPASPAGAADTATGTQELPADIAGLSYEAARDQLVETVRRLESGQGGLEESIALWERGEMLARRCQQWLDGARERLDAAVNSRRGPEDGNGQNA